MQMSGCARMHAANKRRRQQHPQQHAYVQADTHAYRQTRMHTEGDINREFKDVVFEDVVFDNNSYVTPYKVTYSYRIR